MGLAALLLVAASPADTPLPVGGPELERAVAAGESQAFVAALAAGRAYHLAVEQRGIDVVIAVHGPEGSSVATVDGPLDRWGVETVLLRPVAAGSYRVEVRTEKKGVGAGRYAIRLDELPGATPADRERLAALEAMTRGGAALVGRPAGSLDKALAAFQEAREHCKAAGDRRWETESLAALAAVAHLAGRQRQAVDSYRELATRWQELQQPARELRAWADLGLTLWEMSDLPAADDALARGLTLAERLGETYSKTELQSTQCLVLHARGAVQPALDCYREVRALYHQLGEAQEEASVLNNLGYAYYNLGEPQPAEENYRQALAIRQAIGDRAGEAQALNNLAVLFRNLGEIDEALADYGAAQKILASLDDRRQEAATANNMGVAYSALGEAERGRAYLMRALELRRAVEDRRGEVATLNNLGWLERKAGAVDAAIAFHRQALELARALSDPRSEGSSRGYLGEAYTAAGHYTEALAELDRALALNRQIGDHYNEAITLRRQGEALAASGRGGEALPLLEQALTFSRTIGDKVNEAASLSVRTRILRDAGRLEAAASDARAAVAALESLRARLGNPELRASFLGSRSEPYEILVDIMMRLDAAHPGQAFDRAALEASERSRARALLDVVRESGARVRSGVDPALAERQRELERRLTLKADRRQSLLGRGRGDQAESKALEIAIERLTAELDNLDGEIRRQDPRYAGLTRPEVASTAEIQALLDPGTLLLEYALGTERSYLWAIDAGSLRAFVLPGREEVERAARDFYTAVSTPPSPGDESRSRLGEALGRLLLGPVAGELGDRRLAIVADGALHYVPFDVLPEPGAPGGARLLDHHEVVELPSASVLAAERREIARRPTAPQLAIVLADPVFQADDPRVHGGRAEKPTAMASSRRGGEPEAPLRLGRLRFSRQEAQAIAALAPAGAVTTELDFAADRALALSGRLRDYRYVHFATHGLFAATRPELSGLALSRVDPAGQPREGFLRLRDIYDLDLAADLVVLSGCQTALGKEIRGEGLLGLTRGFLYAGAPRVVASLWWIDDRATSELMARFYRGMWVEGLRPAAALRQARRALAAERRFHDPFYWGAFVLQGDWR